MAKRRLTEKEVLEIERLYRQTDMTQMEIAQRFDVAKGMVWFICRHEIWKRLWSWPPHVRPRKHDGREWSDRHYGLLVHCANEAIKGFRSDRMIERADLVSFGWLMCLRHRREDQLVGSSRFTILTMIEYAWFLKTGLHKQRRDAFDGSVVSLTDLEDFDPVDDRDPCRIAIEKELWENVMQTRQWKKLEADKRRMRLKRQADKRQREMIRHAGEPLLPADYMKGL